MAGDTVTHVNCIDTCDAAARCIVSSIYIYIYTIHVNTRTLLGIDDPVIGDEADGGRVRGTVGVQ